MGSAKNWGAVTIEERRNVLVNFVTYQIAEGRYSWALWHSPITSATLEAKTKARGS